MLQWNTIYGAFLEIWMVEFVARENNELALILTLLHVPARVGDMMLDELVQRRTFNVDGLQNIQTNYSQLKPAN